MSTDDSRSPFASLSTYELHRKSFKNAETVKQSTKCGCFHCKKIFDASEVVDFVDERDGQQTAICPYCGIDSVIQDANAEITSEVLDKMHAEWFS